MSFDNLFFKESKWWNILFMFYLFVQFLIDLAFFGRSISDTLLITLSALVTFIIFDAVWMFRKHFVTRREKLRLLGVLIIGALLFYYDTTSLSFTHMFLSGIAFAMFWSFALFVKCAEIELHPEGGFRIIIRTFRSVF